MSNTTRLEDAGKETLPCGPGLHLLTLGIDEIPVKLTTASVDVHLGGSQPALALPEVTGNPEGSDDEDGKVSLEEIRGSTDVLAGLKAKR